MKKFLGLFMALMIVFTGVMSVNAAGIGNVLVLSGNNLNVNGLVQNLKDLCENNNIKLPADFENICIGEGNGLPQNICDILGTCFENIGGINCGGFICPETKPEDNIGSGNGNSDEIPGGNEINGSEFEKRVLELVNSEREKMGLGTLSWSDGLANVARAHSKDMKDRNFFSHTNPDGKSPFERIKEYGISYTTAAENIAMGQSTPEEVMNSWMNSDGHRANILNPNLKYIGVGFYQNYWTQCFIG